MQNWLKFRSFFFIFIFVASRHRRPVASTITFARSSRSHPSVTWTRTPTARSSSKSTSVTFAPCRTCAPWSCACRINIASIASRSTWNVYGCGLPSSGSSNRGTSTKLHTLDRGPFQPVPGLGTKPASFSFSRKPILWKITFVDGTSDSPTWSRGWMSFSMINVRCPSRPSRVPRVEPAGPPPMTITSKSYSGSCVIPRYLLGRHGPAGPHG